MFLGRLIETGHHRAGGQAIDAVLRPLLRHRLHHRGGGQAVLGHGIAEEVGVGVAQLLVKEVDDAPPTPCAGMGQKRLRHSRRAFGVDCHCLNIGRMVDGFGRIEIEHGGAVHQDTPVVQSGGELLDHRGSCGGIGQVTGYDLGRRQGGGQRLRVADRVLHVDHDVPT